MEDVPNVTENEADASQAAAIACSGWSEHIYDIPTVATRRV